MDNKNLQKKKPQTPDVKPEVNPFDNSCDVVKVIIGRRSQVADGHLGRAQMSNEASHWSLRPRLNGPPWSQMANKS